jgi:hypothetical protein
MSRGASVKSARIRGLYGPGTPAFLAFFAATFRVWVKGIGLDGMG